MDTILNAHTSWDNQTGSQSKVARPESKLSAIIGSQKKNGTAWFLISMMIQGVFFLPIPSVLTFYFGAPAYLVIITLGFFFANIIAGMSGARVKTIIYLFGASIIVHLLLLAVFTL
jgi:hypothetical protein